MKTKVLSNSIVFALLPLLNTPLFAPAAEVAVEAWVKRYSNVVSNQRNRDHAVKVVTDSHGDIVVTGSADDGNGVEESRDILTIKYSGADGSVLWSQRYHGLGDDGPAALAIDAIGNVVVAGSSDGDYYTAKYAAADGALLWERRSTNGHATDVAVDTHGNVVVTGTSWGPNTFDYYTAKYAAADGSLLWEQRYDGPVSGDDFANAVAGDASGNVVVTGSSWNGSNREYYTAKYAAANGALLWEQRSTDGVATDVAVDAKGNVIVTGSSWGSNTPEYYTAKYAAEDGSLLWERHDGPASDQYEARSLVVDASGNVVVTGSLSTNNSFDYYTAKFAAADGTLIWDHRHGNGSDSASGMAIDASGNVIVTGPSVGANSDYYTAKYAAADGALIWERRYDSQWNDIAAAVAVDVSGNIVVTGTSGFTGFFGRETSDYYTVKYAAEDGALLWERRYDGPANGQDEPRAVAIDANGNVVVTGFAVTEIGLLGQTPTEYYTAKYASASGALLWEHRYGNGNDSASALAIDASGNVVVTGASYTNNSLDYYTAKYAAADGTLLWSRRYDGPANRDDQPAGVALDASGNVVVTGTSIGIGSDWDYYTAKYAAADGVLLWEQRYNGPANREDKAAALAIDAAGNVVVTGSSFNTNEFGSSDFYTAKYAAHDGTLLWERRYNGPLNGDDRAHAVAIDAVGNVLVEGDTDDSFRGCAGQGICFSARRRYLAKYAAADGALLWEHRSDELWNDSAGQVTVAADSMGDVIVAEASGQEVCGDLFGRWRCWGVVHYYTAKFAGADGAVLWQRQDNDGGGAAVVDADGNVVVTGSSATITDGFLITSDFFTAKYAATNGALVWEKRYDSPANGYDFASALALSPDGSIVITGGSNGDYATVKYVAVSYLTPVVLSLSVTSEGARLRFSGDAGRTYRLQRASNPAGPWPMLATLTAPPEGAVEHLDPVPLVSPAFYRIAAP